MCHYQITFWGLSKIRYTVSKGKKVIIDFLTDLEGCGRWRFYAHSGDGIYQDRGTCDFKMPLDRKAAKRKLRQMVRFADG